MGSPDGPQRLSDVLAQEYESLGRTPGRAGESAPADEAARLRAQRAQVHRFERPLAALCISGGGIRSATFALGALQGLAQRGLLGQFDYLSTVSGGGYIGSWLSAWIHRAGGVDRVAPHLAGRPAEEPGAAAQHDPIQHLREFNNYLTPRLGFASADTWTLAAIVIRNLLLNWLVIVPLLMAVLMIPRILVAALQVDSPFDADPPGFGRIEVTVTRVGLAVGLWSNFQKMRFLPSMGNEPHDDATFVNRCFLPMVASTLLAAVGMWWWWSDGAPRPGLLATVVAMVVLSQLALVGYLLFLQRSHGLAWTARQLFGTAGAGAIVFGVCVGAAIYLLTHQLLLRAQALFDTTGPALYATLAPSLLLSALFLGASFGEGLTSRAMG